MSARKFQLAALMLILFTIITRTPALIQRRPITDEAVYSIVANEIVHGGRPYIDAVERKPPLLFWTYAAVFAAFGSYNFVALHATAVLWLLATMGGLYAIGRRLFDSATGLIAASLYAIFQPWATHENDNLAFNGELLMNLPLVWAYVIAFARNNSRSRPELFVSGALLAVASLLKQPALIAAGPLLLYFLLPSYRAQRGTTVANSVTHALIFLGGIATTFLLVAVELWREGIWRDAIYWSVLDHSVAHFFWKKAVVHSAEFIAICAPLVVGTTLALRTREFWNNKGAERVALIWFLIASAIGTCAGARFYPHYYIQLLPLLSICAAPALKRLFFTVISHVRLATTAWLGACALWFFVVHWTGFAANREPTEAGQYLASHSRFDDRIFVWGHKPAIYVDANRRPACRYILTFPLTGYIFGGPVPGVDTRSRIQPGAWETLQFDFARHPPAYIVDVRDENNAPYPIESFPELRDLIVNDYTIVAQTGEGLIYKRR